MPRILWTREEHLLVFNLYCQIPFGRIHMRNPKVIALAKVLGRTAGAVSRKLANFARLDPAITMTGRKGLPHGSGGEAEVWQEFAENPEAVAFKSTQLLAQWQGRTLEDVAKIPEIELPPEGIERERLVRVRVNQQFFRSAILSAYDNRCCVTGLAVQELLVASHIIPWAQDAKHRMNPRNGLCLNALHDRAFDRGLMVVTENGAVKLRKGLHSTGPEDEIAVRWLWQFDGQLLRLPRKFPPDPTFLAEHRKRWLS
jgi:putative restriction endonuclease